MAVFDRNEKLEKKRKFENYQLNGRAENNISRQNQMIFLWDLCMNKKIPLPYVTEDAFFEIARRAIQQTGFEPLIDDLDLRCIQKVVMQFVKEDVTEDSRRYLQSGANPQLRKLQVLDEMRKKSIGIAKGKGSKDLLEDYSRLVGINVVIKDLENEEGKKREQLIKEKNEKEERKRQSQEGNER